MSLAGFFVQQDRLPEIVLGRQQNDAPGREPFAHGRDELTETLGRPGRSLPAASIANIDAQDWRFANLDARLLQALPAGFLPAAGGNDLSAALPRELHRGDQLAAIIVGVAVVDGWRSHPLVEPEALDRFAVTPAF